MKGNINTYTSDCSHDAKAIAIRRITICSPIYSLFNIYENAIRAFAGDRDFVRRALDELRNADPGNMPKLSEIAPRVSLMVSRDETAFDRPVPRKADLPCDDRPPARVRIRRTGDEEPPF